MKKLISGLAMVPAAIVAGGLLAAPVQAQEWCNPVVSWGNTAVRTAGGGYAIHQGSSLCPAAAPAAAPVAAPVGGLQREYLVFFDWDRSDITPAADRVLSDMITSGRGQPLRVRVVGHTDTSGSPTYNQRLSMRRAEAVQRALVAKGVPAASITTEGRGETELLVRTGDNVREPSNRRAQVLPTAGTGPTS